MKLEYLREYEVILCDSPVMWNFYQTIYPIVQLFYCIIICPTKIAVKTIVYIYYIV